MPTEFLVGFGVMLTQVAVLALVGGLFGISAGALSGRYPGVACAAIRFLRVGPWLPFFAVWAVDLNLEDVNSPTRAIAGMIIIMLELLPMVAFASWYHFLSARFELGLTWRQARGNILQQTILVALLPVFVLQIWMGRYGWDWNGLQSSGFRFRFEAVLLFAGVLFLIDRLFRSDFEQAASRRGAVLVKEMSQGGRRSFVAGFLVGSIGVFVWFAYYMVVVARHIIHSAWDIVTAGHLLLSNIAGHGALGHHIWVSLKEVLGGVMVSGTVSLIVYGGLSRSDVIRRWASHILPLTYITLIMLHPIFFKSGFRWSSQTVVAVALLTFYPFAQALWGLRGGPLGSRILLAVDEALPFGFVAMLWGELMSSVGGVGFAIARAESSSRLAEAIAASLLLFALFLGLSGTLRAIAKRRYFRMPTM